MTDCLYSPHRSAVSILLDEAPRRAMEAHALSRGDGEVAGMMLGPWPARLPDGLYLVEVQDYIPARHTVNHAGLVILTPESWRAIHDEKARRYPDGGMAIVGWLHTYPGLGLFLSESDRFIHRTYFDRPWHIAAVLDPVARAGGFFAWDAALGDIRRHEFVWHWG